MKAHLRGSLLLLLFTVVMCSVLYPLVLFGVGILFPTPASGSLIVEKVKAPDGKETEVVKGSRLIAQPFTDDTYFWPRPSAAEFNATASGGSNFGASNPKLRDRVAQKLGPLVKYRADSISAIAFGNKPPTPQQHIEAWFAVKAERVADWAGEFDTAATSWAKTDYAAKTDSAPERYGLQGDYIAAWAKDHPDVVANWKKANSKKTDEPKPEDLVAFFFTSFAEANPRKWPAIRSPKVGDKRIEPATIAQMTDDPEFDGNLSAIDSNFFEMWLRDPTNAGKAADIEPVMADMVMASGSGLDPHITRRNALSVYQLDRVAAKRTSHGGDGKMIRNDIAELVKQHSFTPLSGLIGEPLVNVLELNRDLDARFPVPAPPKTP